jgi:hypothetical protein
VGDCAFVPDNRNPGKPHPPTAQHAMRQGKVVARYRGCTVGSSAKAIFVQNHWTTGLNRPTDGCSADFRFQFLRMVDVADNLPQQVARLGQKDSSGS